MSLLSEDDSENDLGGEEEYSGYYDVNEDCNEQIQDIDPEYFEYECLSQEKTQQLFNEHVEQLCKSTDMVPSLAMLLLNTHGWDIKTVTQKYKSDSDSILVESKAKPAVAHTVSLSEKLDKDIREILHCAVCMEHHPSTNFCGLSCGHMFCQDCWCMYLEVKISENVSTNIICMERDCDIVVLEDVVLSIVTKPDLRDRYRQCTFRDHVTSHPELRLCPGINCDRVVQAKKLVPKCVVCKFCKTSFCFMCGAEYHAPLTCAILKTWLIKCSDDSETANYICANTKNCPKCQVCIEKNGGCNHIYCSKCGTNFCWVCLVDWESNETEHHQCSAYKEDPEDTQSETAKAREALKRYLHYFERWINHSRSLKLEEWTLKSIKISIDDKLMLKCGTWIDWQYLLDAAALLAKCRYTLQYTYPYAYYMEAGPRKELFEYQQAQLESEIEKLSWKVENTKTASVGDIQIQMEIANNRRKILIKDFFD